MFDALDEIGGDLSGGHDQFREVLANMELDAPNGKITLDENRQAIGTNFVTEVVEDAEWRTGLQGREGCRERQSDPRHGSRAIRDHRPAVARRAGVQGLRVTNAMGRADPVVSPGPPHRWLNEPPSELKGRHGAH